jgi:hypothetical protein
MAIQKQEFYEGAALHLVARSGHVRSVRYDPPFFFLNLKRCCAIKARPVPLSSDVSDYVLTKTNETGSML